MSETRAYRQLSSTAIAIILLTTLLPLTITTTPAFAQAPTITISPTSGFGLPTRVTVEGRGFPPGEAITIRFDATDITDTSDRDSIRETVGPVTTRRTDADGAFRARVLVPAAPFGSHTISVTVGTVTATATFTVNPRIRLCANSACTLFRTSGFPDQSLDTFIDVSGFGPSETVTITLSAAFTTDSVSVTTGPDGRFRDTTARSLIVRRTTGGEKVITAASDTTSADTRFTVSAAVAFYTSQTSGTSFSVRSETLTTTFIEGYGFPLGTIPANSITIGGVSMGHPAITVGSSGLFGIGAGAHIPLTPSAAIPLGPVEAVIRGITFSFTAGNIICNIASAPTNICPTGGAVGFVAFGWGAPLISSRPDTTGAGTAVVTLNKGSFLPGAAAAERMVLFGYGFDAATAVTVVSSPGFTFTGTGARDANGAFWHRSEAGMGELAAGTYTVTLTGGGVANIILPTYRPRAWVQWPAFPDPTTVDYKTPIGNLIVHGFTASSTVTVTIGTRTVGTTTVGPNGDNTASPLAVGTVDLAGGSYDIVATDLAGVSATESGAIAVIPLVDRDPGVNNALTENTGSAGTFTVLRSGSNFGVHGLKANTAYKIHWGLDAAAPTLATFTTNALGQIPPPGVAITLPVSTAGIHILVIREAATGADALFGVVVGHPTSSLSTSTVTIASRYGDLLIRFEVSLLATPSVGGVGTTVALSGSGLRPNTNYVITITTPPTPPATGQIYATFTSTADGSVPAGFTFTFPELPTSIAGGNTEKATTYFIHVSRAGQYPGAQDGQARFVLQATASLDKTVANAGDSVTISAKGLAAGGVYTVQFGFKSDTDPGTTVASLAANAVGTGSATFTIPSGTAAGTHTVQLVATAGPLAGKSVLVIAPTIQVGVVEAAGRVDTTTFQNTAKSDKTSYRPGETVTISADLRVESGTGRVNFVVTIKDAAGNVILVNKMANVPLTTDPVTLTVQTTITKPGTYTANIQVLTPADVPIAFKIVTFTVG